MPYARRAAVAAAVAGLAACSSAGTGAPGTLRVPSAAAPHSASAKPTCALPLSTWTVPQLAGAVITAPVHMDDLSAADAMVAAGVGGLILEGADPPKDLAAQLKQLRTKAPMHWPLLVGSDEEGGAVEHLSALTGALPSARAQTLTGRATIQAQAEVLGRRLHALGVTEDFAPVADLDDGPGPDSQHPDGTRSFSIDPQVASRAVTAFVAGLQAGGEVAVTKHFPGLGTASGNTDNGAATTANWSTFADRDLLPFEAAISAHTKAVMISNATTPGLTTGPATLSAAAVGVLRNQLHFTGAVFTDSLSAGAINKAGETIGSAAAKALEAGADDVLFGTADTPDPAGTAEELRQQITLAVNGGALTRARLQQAAQHDAALAGVRTC